MIDAHDLCAVRSGENPSEVEGENRSYDVGIQEEAWRGQSGSIWAASTRSAERVCVCTDQSAVSVLFTAISDTLANALVRRASAGGVVCCSAARMWDCRRDILDAL